MLHFIHVMLVPGKFGSFDPEPMTLWTFLELLSELKSTVNVVVALGAKLKEQNFIDWLCCLNLEKCQEMFRKNGFVSLLGEGNKPANLGTATELTGKLGIWVMTWANQSGKDFLLHQQGNYCSVFPSTCVCVIELKILVKGD